MLHWLGCRRETASPARLHGLSATPLLCALHLLQALPEQSTQITPGSAATQAGLARCRLSAELKEAEQAQQAAEGQLQQAVAQRGAALCELRETEASLHKVRFASL